MPHFYCEDGKGSRVSIQEYCLSSKILTVQKSQEVGKREKLQLHLCECKSTEIQGFPACHQKPQMILVQPKYRHWTSSEQIKKAFTWKQMVKFLLVEKPPISPCQILIFFLNKQQYQVFSQRCFFFQIIYKKTDCFRRHQCAQQLILLYQNMANTSKDKGCSF